VRLSDAERERLFEQLSSHAAAGRIALDELERRVAALEASESREQAAEVMADLPFVPATGVQDSASHRRWGRGYGHAAAEAPQPDWHPTAERFRDPGTDQVMRVWLDAAGARHYVVDDGA
jgi:hypothetical protein